MLHDYFYNFFLLMHFILRWVSHFCIAFCTHTPIWPYMTFICNIKTQFVHFSAKIKKKNRVFFSKLPPLNNNVRVFGVKKGILWTGATPKQIPYTHFISWHKLFPQVQFQITRFITVFDEFGPILRHGVKWAKLEVLVFKLFLLLIIH